MEWTGMKNALTSGLREVSWLRALTGILAMVAVIVFASTESLIRVYRERQMLEYGYHTNLILAALQSDTVASFLPILAVLSFSAVYIDDVKSKFARFFLIRTNYTIYLISRILVCFLSGGIVIASGTLLAWGLSTLFFLPMEKASEAPLESTDLLLKTCTLLFLDGGFWAIMGMAMSTLMESKYISYATPFVFYYLLVILYERYFSDLFIIYPKTWTDPAAWPFGCWGAAIFLLEMTLIFAILFAFRARRRLQQL